MVNKKKRYRKVKFTSLMVNIDIIGCSAYLRTGNNKTIGSCTWSINKEELTMYVSDFGIENEYQSKGYGNFLARIIIDLARLYHLKSITLTNGSTLENFWQRLEFKTKFVRRNKAYIDTGHLVLKL